MIAMTVAPLSESSDLGVARLWVHLPGTKKVMGSIHNAATKNPYKAILVQHSGIPL